MQATRPQHDLGLGVAVAMPNGVHDTGNRDGAGVPVVDGSPTGHGHGGADAGGHGGRHGLRCGQRRVDDGA